ncbi:receptor-like protein 9b [Glycine soja]|nr:receptor-like protein 9b [Glycine soja]
MSSLKTLDLSDNQLFGEIPEGIFGVLYQSKGYTYIGTYKAEHSPFESQSLYWRYTKGVVPIDRFKHTTPFSSQFFWCIFNCLGKVPFEIKYPDLFLEILSGRILVDHKYCMPFDTPILPNVEEKANFTSKNRTNTYTGRILAYMSGVDLSSNKLLRNIPSELGNMRRIRSLNLSHDDLTGQIPTTFSNLVHGKSLNLSFNKLSGQIPPQLSVLSSLDVFIVAHNNLSGATPERKGQFSTFEESSYKGNQFLCGPPLPKSCNPLPLILPNDEGSDSLVDMFVFYVSFVVSYISALLVTAAALYINPYWRQAWVYYIELMNLNCYYFIMDNLCKLFKNENM